MTPCDVTRAFTIFFFFKTVASQTTTHSPFSNSCPSSKTAHRSQRTTSGLVLHSLQWVQFQPIYLHQYTIYKILDVGKRWSLITGATANNNLKHSISYINMRKMKESSPLYDLHHKAKLHNHVIIYIKKCPKGFLHASTHKSRKEDNY